MGSNVLTPGPVTRGPVTRGPVTRGLIARGMARPWGDTGGRALPGGRVGWRGAQPITMGTTALFHVKHRAANPAAVRDDDDWHV